MFQSFPALRLSEHSYLSLTDFTYLFILPTIFKNYKFNLNSLLIFSIFTSIILILWVIKSQNIFSLLSSDVRLILGLLVLNFCIKNTMMTEKDKDNIILVSIIAVIYSFYSSFLELKFGFPHLIPSFIDGAFEPTPRFRGFTSEASLFAFFLTVPLLITLQRKTYFLFFFFLFSLFLNVSSSIAIILLFIIFNINGGIKIIFFSTFIILLVAFSSLFIFGWEVIYYTLVTKSNTYMSVLSGSKNFFLDSGMIRGGSFMIGIEIFKNYPFFGIGSGQSLNVFSEYFTNYFSLDEPIGPQLIMSSVAKMLAEYGWFGLLILIWTIVQWKNMLSSCSTSSTLSGYLIILYGLFVLYPLESAIILLTLTMIMKILQVKDNLSN